MKNEVPAVTFTWTSREAYLLAVVCLFSGLTLGYLIRGSGGTAPAVTSAATPAQASLPSAENLAVLAAPLLAQIQVEPKNRKALVDLGNLYYDHHAYAQAVPYYQRALDILPDDVNVRTDLGTAFWYSGSPEKAIAEYQQALQVKEGFPNALLNTGIVKMEGLKDYAGAIAAWEELLKKNPNFAEKQRVLDLIAQAKTQAAGPAVPFNPKKK
jgi:tetratricopeptide (TPR) repeat protein